MRVNEISRRDIEARMNSMGDFVKMDYLLSCLKKNNDFETRKFIFLKLSELYEARKIYFEAGRMLQNAATIDISSIKKIDYYTGAAALFIQGGKLDDADSAFEKAMAVSNLEQKEKINLKKVECYKIQAKLLLAKDKRNSAMLMFERLLRLNLQEEDKKETQRNLLDLYNKLGKVKEYIALKKII